MKFNGRWRTQESEWKTPRCGRWRERWWTPTRAKTQDTRASPNSLETHLVRKWGDIGHLRALSPWRNEWMDWYIYICKIILSFSFHWLYRDSINIRAQTENMRTQVFQLRKQNRWKPSHRFWSLLGNLSQFYKDWGTTKTRRTEERRRDARHLRKSVQGFN